MKSFTQHISEADAFKPHSASDNIVSHYIGQAKSALDHILSDEGARIAMENLVKAKENIRRPRKPKTLLIPLKDGSGAKAVTVEGSGEVGTDPWLVAEVERLMRVVGKRLEGGVTGFRTGPKFDFAAVTRMTVAKFMAEFAAEHPNATAAERKAVEVAFRAFKQECAHALKDRVSPMQTQAAMARATELGAALEAAMVAVKSR
jgi:hypothetical protein